MVYKAKRADGFCQKYHLGQTQRGFTLTEIMVALLLSGILLATGLAMFTATAKYSTQTMRAIKLHQELTLSLEMMASEIRRAGYWSNALSDLGTEANTNPFMAAGTDLTISPSQDCILFSYDRDNTGVLPPLKTAPDDNRYGFRLYNGAIQARDVNSDFNCSVVGNAWPDITDSSTIKITGLTFTPEIVTIAKPLDVSGTAYLDIRNVVMTITGYYVDDPSLTQTLSYRVRIRNDKYRQ